MMQGRAKITSRVLPLGWCMAPEGAESHKACPDKITHSGGRHKDSVELCICQCHGNREDQYSETQKARMAADAPSPQTDDEDGDDQED